MNDSDTRELNEHGGLEQSFFITYVLKVPRLTNWAIRPFDTQSKFDFINGI